MPITGLNLVVLTGGWPGGWVAGSNENNANSASVEVEVEVEAELGNTKDSETLITIIAQKII